MTDAPPACARDGPRSPYTRGLRALVVSPDYPPSRGGIQVLAEAVTRGMTRIEPTVVTRGERGAPAGGQRVWRVGSGRAGKTALNPAALAAGLRHRPDVVLSVHILAAPAAQTLRRVLGVPVVQYLHADEVRNRAALARFGLSRADAVVAVSRYTRDLALAHGARPDRVHLISPGVHLPAPEAPPTPRAAEPTILTVGRLDTRHKGHDMLIRALPRVRERVPGVRWVVVGDGALRADFEREALEAGLDGTVTFLGAAGDAERDRWLRSAHVFAMPTRLPPDGPGGEGFGIVYLEAAAHGLPCVAGAVGGAADAVKDGETGLLVDATRPEPVAEALVALLTDEARAAAMGDAGRAWARSRAWPLVAREVEDLLLATAG